MEPDHDVFFRALGDETRRRIVFLLHQGGELCVCELTAALGLSQPKISRHLAHLRTTGLVVDRRRGQWIFYRLAGGLPAWVMEVLAAAREGARTSAPYGDDTAALATLPERPGEAACR